MRSAQVTGHGFAIGAAAPSWGRFAGERDPLAAAAAAMISRHNERLRRLDRQTLSALVAARLVLDGDTTPTSLVVAVEEGSAAADRTYWATAREHGGTQASPMLFAGTLPSAVAGELAMTFAVRGPCIVVAGAGAFAASQALAASPPCGTCLRVRLRGWDTGIDGESVASL